MIIIGIDPGKSGGLAMLVGNHWHAVEKMPDNPVDLGELLESWLPHSLRDEPTRVFMEKLSSYPQQAVTNFKLGRNIGCILGVLATKGIGVEQVAPSVWMKGVGYARKSKDDAQHKRDLRSHALELYPTSGVTLDSCDALLIAEHGRRLETRGTNDD